MGIQTVSATKPVEDFRLEFLALLRRHSGGLSSTEIFAVSCQLAGQIAAHLDANSVTRDHVIEMLTANFQLGNAAAVEAIIGQNGGRH